MQTNKSEYHNEPKWPKSLTDLKTAETMWKISLLKEFLRVLTFKIDGPDNFTVKFLLWLVDQSEGLTKNVYAVFPEGSQIFTERSGIMFTAWGQPVVISKTIGLLRYWVLIVHFLILDQHWHNQAWLKRKERLDYGKIQCQNLADRPDRTK